jgi:hypothetical protein
VRGELKIQCGCLAMSNSCKNHSVGFDGRNVWTASNPCKDGTKHGIDPISETTQSSETITQRYLTSGPRGANDRRAMNRRGRASCTLWDRDTCWYEQVSVSSRR